MSDRPDRNEQRRARELAAQHGISYQQALHRLRAQSPMPRPVGVFATAHMAQILTLARRESDLLGQGRDVVTEHVLLALIWDGTGPVAARYELGVAKRIDARVGRLISLPTYRPNRDDMAALMRHVRDYMNTYGDDETEADHMLAAMTHLQTGGIAQVLDELAIREQLRELVTTSLKRNEQLHDRSRKTTGN